MYKHALLLKLTNIKSHWIGAIIKRILVMETERYKTVYSEKIRVKKNIPLNLCCENHVQSAGFAMSWVTPCGK